MSSSETLAPSAVVSSGSAPTRAFLRDRKTRIDEVDREMDRLHRAISQHEDESIGVKEIQWNEFRTKIETMVNGFGDVEKFDDVDAYNILKGFLINSVQAIKSENAKSSSLEILAKLLEKVIERLEEDMKAVTGHESDFSLMIKDFAKSAPFERCRKVVECTELFPVYFKGHRAEFVRETNVLKSRRQFIRDFKSLLDRHKKAFSRCLSELQGKITEIEQAKTTAEDYKKQLDVLETEYLELVDDDLVGSETESTIVPPAEITEVRTEAASALTTPAESELAVSLSVLGPESTTVHVSANHSEHKGKATAGMSTPQPPTERDKKKEEAIIETPLPQNPEPLNQPQKAISSAEALEKMRQYLLKALKAESEAELLKRRAELSAQKTLLGQQLGEARSQVAQQESEMEVYRMQVVEQEQGKTAQRITQEKEKSRQTIRSTEKDIKLLKASASAHRMQVQSLLQGNEEIKKSRDTILAENAALEVQASKLQNQIEVTSQAFNSLS
jgi:predicted DNA binding CopG/RHH family protein